MKKKLVFFMLIIFSLSILSGCSASKREERQMKSSALAFLKAKANLSYKTINGKEGSKFATAAAKNKLNEDAKQQVAVFKDAKGTSSLVGTPIIKITKKTAQIADIESDLKLKVKSEVNKQSNAIVDFKYKATLKKVANQWLVDSWGFASK